MRTKVRSGFTPVELPVVSRRKGNAFTLVELLVVVGIISVLVAMLLPALGKARRQADSLVCQSNLRQVYVAFLQYANDNHGVVPAYRQYGAPLWDYYWKPLSTGGYLGKGESYGGANGPRYPSLRCPSEPGAYLAAQPPTQAITTMYDSQHACSSYAMNFMMNYGAWFENAVHKFGVRTMPGFYSSTYLDGRVHSAAQVSFLMDCPRWFAYGWSSPEFGYAIDFDFGDGWGLLGSSFYAFRHPNKRANILYYDGHVDTQQHKFATGKNVWTWKYP